MIFYFSGTGNSRYVAKKIAAITGDEPVNLNERIKNNDYGKVACSDRAVFVVPTYAWRIPKIVENWISRTELDCDRVWFVMTCGGEIGNAAKYNRRLCENKHFTYMGTAQIVMPENYIAMFGAPEWDDAKKIIAKSEPDIQRAGELIRDGLEFAAPRNNAYDRMMSGIVNPFFYKSAVKAKDFYVKDGCTGCGLCADLCPLNNIHLADGRPVWDNSCTHCMACICHCPAEAIEYGKKSAGKPRYLCRYE